MGIGNIGWSEALVILLIVLVFFGPRRLPEIANAIGRSLREFRKALNEVTTEISHAGSAQEGSQESHARRNAPPYGLEPPAARTRKEAGPVEKVTEATGKVAGTETGAAARPGSEEGEVEDADPGDPDTTKG
jgi:sec-independent protein translocase protein TatA